ncbi:uncharacterized protein BDR25DRAFT_325363 [Lindgomyces ingoldianus]|uniref:Uncharacterized protein n=1 Tax=Lindgomyces ingoldianus TaxID=673940 RepID=A0ACB6QXT1_9PLEO|nr:uncharacterized protein BDR25DRAFT_325363 [Lindgomyces ingoldianus]KAF2471087.1 hypothetical protein BDR25DRAFT_325363 [Lindgomyces ingoldianus]
MSFAFGTGSTPNKLLFGAANTSGGSTPSLFGSTTNNANAGSNTPASSNSFIGGNSGSSTLFSGGSSSNTPAASKPSLFGAIQPTSGATQPSSGTFPFGNNGATSGTTSNAPLSLFASKPATTSASYSPGLFAPASSSSAPAKPLGSTPTSQDSFNFATGSSNLFGGPSRNTAGGSNLFGVNANQGGPSQQSNTSTSSTLFGTQATPKPSLFNVSGTAPALSTPFSLGSTPAATQPANPPASTGAPPSNIGGGSAGNLFNLGKPNGPTQGSIAATSSAPPITSAGATPTLFPGLGNNTTTSSAPASTNTAAPSMFSGLGSKTTTTSVQPSTSTTTTAPAAAAARGTSGNGTANPPPATSGPTGGDATKTTTTGLGSSTAGPTPSTQSRLKNKSMDEIITRWAADLSKYQKEFQTQADQVALWDRAIVENSDKVTKLYSKTFQAERDAAEQELEAYLDKYEKEVEGMMQNHGMSGSGRSDVEKNNSDPDSDPFTRYKLAEKLQDRLNELNKDLTEMIEEINSTSQTLSKTGKPDDPLTKVVRVLNGQLAQLQLIDSGASQLQDKIKATQKESHRVGANGWNGLGTDPTEDFYRSFRGGRGERFGGVS